MKALAEVPRVETCSLCSDPRAPGSYWCDRHKAEERARERRRREEEAQQQRGPWLREIGIPGGLRWIDFASIDATPAVKIIEAYADKPVRRGDALVILGPTGVGKTVVAVALVDAMLPDFRTSQRFECGLTLVRELHDFDTCDEAMERCTRPRLLVIDDLPKVTDERVAQAVEELLIVREANRLATVITSNVAPKHLATLLSDRVIDRLRAWGRIEAVTGPSLRSAPEPESKS